MDRLDPDYYDWVDNMIEFLEEGQPEDNLWLGKFLYFYV